MSGPVLLPTSDGVKTEEEELIPIKHFLAFTVARAEFLQLQLDSMAAAAKTQEKVEAARQNIMKVCGLVEGDSFHASTGVITRKK